MGSWFRCLWIWRTHGICEGPSKSQWLGSTGKGCKEWNMLWKRAEGKSKRSSSSGEIRRLMIWCGWSLLDWWTSALNAQTLRPWEEPNHQNVSKMFHDVSRWSTAGWQISADFSRFQDWCHRLQKFCTCLKVRTSTQKSRSSGSNECTTGEHGHCTLDSEAWMDLYLADSTDERLTHKVNCTVWIHLTRFISQGRLQDTNLLFIFHTTSIISFS